MFIAREHIVHAGCGAAQARLAQIASATGLVSTSQATGRRVSLMFLREPI
jgi:hypothetical protein